VEVPFRATSWIPADDLAQLRMLARKDMTSALTPARIRSYLASRPNSCRTKSVGAGNSSSCARGPVPHFAYPNGRREDYTREAVDAVARAGLRCGL